MLPVYHTWYIRRLGLLCVDELAAVSAYRFAFAPGRQAKGVLFTIRQLLEKNLRFPWTTVTKKLWVTVITICGCPCSPLLITFGSLREPKALQRMFREWTTALHDHGLNTGRQPFGQTVRMASGVHQWLVSRV